MTNPSTPTPEVPAPIIAFASTAGAPSETASGERPASRVRARDWFAGGERVLFDRRAGKVVQSDDVDPSAGAVHVFRRIDDVEERGEGAVWTSFLPGWPDGSFGWATVDQMLAGKDIGPRLFLDYVGHGDSDKPVDYPYGTIERADLVEALWEAEGVRSTFLVCFDYSSIVALELLARRLDRRTAGIDEGTRIEGVMLANGGLFVDAHTHPWFTTPVLKSPLGGLVTSLAQHSKVAFRELMKPLWSEDYEVTPEEIDDLYDAIGWAKGFATGTHAFKTPDETTQAALAKKPALAIWGEADRTLQAEHFLPLFHQAFPDGLVHRLPWVGHYSPEDAPEEVARLVSDFVDENGA